MNYLDVQPQETHAYTVSLREYANMLMLRNEWNVRIWMEMKIRALNPLKDLD